MRRFFRGVGVKLAHQDLDVVSEDQTSKQDTVQLGLTSNFSVLSVCETS